MNAPDPLVDAGGGLAPAYSLYLDLVRALAALAVVVAHFGFFKILDPGQVARIPDFGREAVMAFFVLSGFVIAYSAEYRYPRLADYAAARAARLYAVAVPVLLLSFVLGGIVLALVPGPVEGGYALRRPWLYLPFHLLFLGDAWAFAERPPWLLPYWSLDYEAWYYVLFGLAWYLRGRARLLACGVVLALVGPRLWLLLPVWLGGVALYRWQKTASLPRGPARLGWVLTAAAILLWGCSGIETGLRALALDAWPFPGIRLGSADRVLADYPVALLVMANFACARAAAFGWVTRLGRPVRWLADRSFTLYLSHGVVIGLWRALVPFERGSTAAICALAVAIGVVTTGLYPLTECLRRWLRAVPDRRQAAVQATR